MKNNKKETAMLVVSFIGVISILLVSMQYLANIQISETEHETSKFSAFIALSVIAGSQISRKLRNWREVTATVRILMVLFSLVDVIFLIGGGYFLLVVL